MPCLRARRRPAAPPRARSGVSSPSRGSDLLVIARLVCVVCSLSLLTACSALGEGEDVPNAPTEGGVGDSPPDPIEDMTTTMGDVRGCVGDLCNNAPPNPDPPDEDVSDMQQSGDGDMESEPDMTADPDMNEPVPLVFDGQVTGYFGLFGPTSTAQTPSGGQLFSTLGTEAVAPGVLRSSTHTLRSGPPAVTWP